MYDYDESFQRDELARLQRLYAQQLQQYDDLLFATHEGIFEVTIRSSTTTQTIAIGNHSEEVGQAIVEALQSRINRTEHTLNHVSLMIGTIIKSERNAAARREQEREETQQRNQEECARQVQQGKDEGLNARVQQHLAQQAAAVPKAPARPRKSSAKPQRAVSHAIGQAAAAVPMNVTTNQPQG